MNGVYAGAIRSPDRDSQLSRCQQLGGPYLQSLGQTLKHIDARGVLLALDHADIVAVDAGKIGELLLSQPAVLPELPQVLSQDAPECHGLEGSPSPIAAPPSILGILLGRLILPVSQLSRFLSVEIGFARDSDGESYVVSLAAPESVGTLAALRLPAHIVEPIVLAGAGVQLELRVDGRVVAYSDRLEAKDLVAHSLNELVTEALDVLSPAEDADELAELQVTLEAILSAVIEARARLR